MPRFTSADKVHAYLDWRDELIGAAGDVPAYRSPAFFAADPKVQAASYELHEVPRQISNRMAAEYQQRVDERDASHAISAAGHGEWTAAGNRALQGRGDYIPREPGLPRSRGDPVEHRVDAAVDRAGDAVAALTEQDRQHDAATAAATQETDHAEEEWTA